MPDDTTDIKTIVTKREDSIERNVTARTPEGSPDVRVIPMTMVKQTFVRALRTYVMSLSGLLLAGGIGADQGVLPDRFGSLLWACAGMALAPTVMSVLTNMAELLARIDESFPQMRA
jgi:hypothetical protein